MTKLWTCYACLYERIWDLDETARAVGQLEKVVLEKYDR
jgi:hypothetical protein